LRWLPLPWKALALILALCGILASGCAGKKAAQPEPGRWTETRPPASVSADTYGAEGVPEESTAPEEYTGVHHEVKPGETLWRIAKTYEVDLETLQWVNDVEDVTDLRIGRILFIPGAREVRVVPSFVPEELVPPPEGTIRVSWPLKGRFTSGFGMRGNRKHEGIDLAAPTGTPVRAAASGRVVYSGSGMRGYGKVVVLKHEKEFSTVYAHNSVLLVKRGQKVKKGQVISRVGSTGWATGPHLHFEVRRRGVAEDPMGYLPPL